jgi:hypothetical protein
MDMRAHTYIDYKESALNVGLVSFSVDRHTRVKFYPNHRPYRAFHLFRIIGVSRIEARI